jgi:hypothetical protein
MSPLFAKPFVTGKQSTPLQLANLHGLKDASCSVPVTYTLLAAAAG